MVVPLAMDDRRVDSVRAEETVSLDESLQRPIVPSAALTLYQSIELYALLGRLEVEERSAVPESFLEKVQLMASTLQIHRH